MTNRNALVLCGLFTALSLQAGQPSQSSQPTSQQAASDQEGMSWRKKLGIGALGLGGTLAAGSYYAPGWRDYFLNKSSDALGSAGNVLSSAGGYASRAWDWSKGVPYAGVVPRAAGQLGSMGYDYGQRAASAGWQGLKATPSVAWEGLKSAPGTIAGYATSPYIAQSIAQRLPRASFVKDYPGTTNIAAALAAAGTGYGLYKGGQRAVDWYRGPEYTLAAKLFLENPYEGIYQKSERLLNQKPFDNALQNALFYQRILQLSIDAFKNERDGLKAQAEALWSQAASLTGQEQLNISEMASAIEDYTIPSVDLTIKKFQASYDKVSQDIKNAQNKASEQTPGWFGWWKRK